MVFTLYDNSIKNIYIKVNYFQTVSHLSGHHGPRVQLHVTEVLGLEAGNSSAVICRVKWATSKRKTVTRIRVHVS